MNMPLVSLNNVNLQIGNQTILQTISFDIQTKEIITVIGPNGAGKSSLIKLISGLTQPTAGKIIRKPSLRLGYVPQKLHLDKSLPLKVSRFLSLANVSKTARNNALATLSIEHLSTKQMHSLSGGELQRVLLARAVARKPDLLLLDEPLQGVDVNGQVELYRLIAQLRDQLHCAILMVSHDLHLVMAQTDSVLCLNQHICCHGRPESVSQHPEYLKLFGRKAAAEIAVYTHHHDHHHAIDGHIEHCNSECNHD